MNKFKVIQSNPTEKGTFVTKLQRESLINHPLFGEKRKQETYYVSGGKQVPEGTEISYDDLMRGMRVVSREFETEEGEKMILKWLSIA